MGLDRQKEHMNIDHGFGAANPRDAVNIGYTIYLRLVGRFDS